MVLYTARMVDAQHLEPAERLQRKLFTVLTGLFILAAVVIVGLGIQGG